MQYEEFLNKVQDRIGPTQPDEARRAIIATLETLGERISGGEANDLVEQLPEELKEPLQPAGEDNEEFSLDEFLRRVSEREDVDTEAVRNHASAVMTVLREAVTGGELDNIRAQLPQEFEPLWTCWMRWRPRRAASRPMSSPRKAIPHEFETNRSLEEGGAVWVAPPEPKARVAECEQ